MKMKSIVSMMVFLVLIVTISTGWGAEVGEQIPEFVVRTFDNRTQSRATLSGRPALLVFWNTWCDECKRDLPRINRMAREFGPRGLVVLAINTGLNDNENRARAYWKRYGYGFSTGYDYSFELGKNFRVRGVPTVFLVDIRGIVRYKDSVPPGDMGERFKALTTHHAAN